MKIVVIGTSNSVLGVKGFIESLKLQHEVILISSGRTPFLASLKSIINNKKLIESCDLMILEHYVNDVNFYSYCLEDFYDELCVEFYNYLSSLNVRILNVLFPIQDIENSDAKYFNRPFYDFVKSLSARHKISCLDLNKYDFLQHHFQDRLHLKINASYTFGLFLSNYLNAEDTGAKPEGGRCDTMPFSLIKLSELVSNNKVKTYKNSLLEVDYADIRNDFLIKRENTDKLISVGYLRPKEEEGLSGIILNNEHTVGLNDTGYFHETINLDLFGDVHISPLQGEHKVRNLMERGKSEGLFSYCYLTEFLFYNSEVELIMTPASRHEFIINLPGLLDVVKRMVPEQEKENKFPELQPKTITMLTNIAIDLENDNRDVAMELMMLAHIARPKGHVINKKLDEYNNKKKDLNKNQTELKRMIDSGDVVIIPAGFRCHTKMNLFKVLNFTQVSMPFDNGFFPPDSIASLLEKGRVNLQYPDTNNITHTVCIKSENHIVQELGKGIMFQTSTYTDINDIVISRSMLDVNKYLDSTFGYYTLDIENNFVLAHYNWHMLATKTKSNGVYDTASNIRNINDMLNKRIKRMFDICNKAKHIFFVFGEYQNYQYMKIDDKVFNLHDFKKLSSVANQKFDNKCIITKYSDVNSAEKLLNLLPPHVNHK
jgi:hypothetical protein